MKYRRLVTLPALFLGTPLVTLGLPVLVVAAVLIDLVLLRWKFPTLRCGLFGFCYLWLTVVGMIWAAGLWLRSGIIGLRSPASLERHRVLQAWWVTHLIGAAEPLLGLRIEVDGIDRIERGNALVLSRHTSLLDAVVSFVVIGLQGSKKARYVLKDDLAWEPALDVVGNRLPNHFVDRTGRDSGAELEAVGNLGNDMSHDEVVVIFPEGTFPAPHRRTRALARLEAGDPGFHRRAESLQTLLPPRSGGTLRLLATAPDADVVLLGHVGFEAFSSMANILRSVPFSQPVQVKLWRHDRATIPTDASAQRDWLLDRWVELDTWVTEQLALRTP